MRAEQEADWRNKKDARNLTQPAAAMERLQAPLIIGVTFEIHTVDAKKRQPRAPVL
jgi:hypothetical protein